MTTFEKARHKAASSAAANAEIERLKRSLE